MHPALSFLLRTLAALMVCMVGAFLLAGCGGGSTATCTAIGTPPAQATLTLDAPVGTLGTVALSPTAAAEVLATTTVQVSGTGTHGVVVYLTSQPAGQRARTVGKFVEVQAGAAQQVTVTGHVPPGGQTLALAYALVGNTAPGETVTATAITFEVCAP